MAAELDASEASAPRIARPNVHIIVPSIRPDPSATSESEGSVINTPITTTTDNEGSVLDSPEKDSFRLFTVVSKSGQKVAIKLRTYLLSSQPLPPYQALSYTREGEEGDDSDNSSDSPSDSGTLRITKAVYRDEVPIIIPNGLHSFLKRSARLGTLYWAEAICINKREITERNDHVLLSSRIIRGAQSSVFWLGSRIPVSLHRTLEDVAAESWSDEGSLIRGQLRHEHIATAPRDTGGHAADARGGRRVIFRGGASVVQVIELFRHPWFHSPWRLQEMLLARDALICCENWSMPWSTVRQVVLYLASRYPGSIHPRVRSLVELDLSSREEKSSLGGFDIRYSWQELKYREAIADGKRRILRPSNLLALPHTEHVKPADSMDRVYPVLGAAIRSPQFFPFAPDYTLSVRVAYILAARAIIQKEQNLNILSLVHRRRGWPATPDLLLPSWVPDWRSRALCDGFSQMHGINTFEYQVAQGELDEPLNVFETGEVPKGPEWLRMYTRPRPRPLTGDAPKKAAKVKQSVVDDDLRVKGLLVNTVSQIVDLSPLTSLLQFDDDSDDPPPEIDWHMVIVALRSIIGVIQSWLKSLDGRAEAKPGAPNEADQNPGEDEDENDDFFSDIFTALTADRFRTVQSNGPRVKHSFLIYLEMAHWMTPLTNKIRVRPPPPPGMLTPTSPIAVPPTQSHETSRLAQAARVYGLVARHRRRQQRDERSTPATPVTPVTPATPVTPTITITTSDTEPAASPHPMTPISPPTSARSSPGPHTSSVPGFFQAARDALLQRMARALLIDDPEASDAFFAPWNAYAAAYGALGPVSEAAAAAPPPHAPPSPTPSSPASSSSLSSSPSTQPPPTPATEDDGSDDDEDLLAEPTPVQARLAYELIRVLSRTLRGRSFAIMSPGPGPSTSPFPTSSPRPQPQSPSPKSTQPSRSTTGTPAPPHHSDHHRARHPHQRVGLVPSTTLPSDQLFILKGGDVPFVLRPRTPSSAAAAAIAPVGRRSLHVAPGRYLVLGDAFVPGVMDGEAVEVASGPVVAGGSRGSGSGSSSRLVIRGADGREFEDLDLV